MYANRFLIVLGVFSLLLVAMVISFPPSNMPKSAESGRAADVDSASHSYIAWAQAAEAEASTVDSATRSYLAQAKAATCGVEAAYGPSLDSATRSYIAWGLALQAKNDVGALCR
jgi:hypothetical protein